MDEARAKIGKELAMGLGELCGEEPKHLHGWMTAPGSEEVKFDQLLAKPSRTEPRPSGYVQRVGGTARNIAGIAKTLCTKITAWGEIETRRSLEEEEVQAKLAKLKTEERLLHRYKQGTVLENSQEKECQRESWKSVPKRAWT